MIYIKHNAQREIIDIQFTPETGYVQAGLFDQEVKAFLSNQQNEQLIKDILKQLDADMVRVIEDVVEILIDKGIMRFTDLPEPVQNKLMFKKSLRQSLNNETTFYDEEDLPI